MKKFNIQESGKVKKFLRVYYEWGHDAKGAYSKMTMKKDVKKLVEGYKKYTAGQVKEQKITVAHGTTISKGDFDETHNIDEYISLVGQLLWYTNKVGPDVKNASGELAVHMRHPRPEHWKALGFLIGNLKVRIINSLSSEILRF